MKGIILERNHAIEQSVARPSENQVTWRTIRGREESMKRKNHCSVQNVTGAFPHQVKIHEGNYIGEKPFNCTKCGKRFFTIKRLEVPSEDPWRKQPLKCNKCDSSFSTSGEDSWRELHWREAIQLHKVWQELLKIKILKSTIRGSMKEATIEVSGVFPHHNSWEVSQWREAIQVH